MIAAKQGLASAAGIPEEQNPLNPDAELIQLCQQGDPKAFQEMVEKYRTRVASISYQVIGNYEDARDVAQEVFIKLYKGINGFDPRKKFFTWLYRLTINASIDHLRAKKRRSYVNSFDERPEQYANFPGTDYEVAAQDFEKRELWQIFIDQAEKLSPKQRAAFVLCDLQGYSTDEAVEMLYCPKVTLRWHLREARKSIRVAIARHHPEYWRDRKNAVDESAAVS